MNIYYSLSFAYFHMQNNFLPIIYFYSMRNWPSSSVFDRFSTLIFSKTKRHMNKFYSILSACFFMQNRPIADCNIAAATPCMYELSKSCVCRLFLSVSFTTFVFSAPLYTTMHEWISAAYFGQLNGQHDIRRLLVLQPAFLSIYGYRGGGGGGHPFITTKLSSFLNVCTSPLFRTFYQKDQSFFPLQRFLVYLRCLLTKENKLR